MPKPQHLLPPFMTEMQFERLRRAARQMIELLDLRKAHIKLMAAAAQPK